MSTAPAPAGKIPEVAQLLERLGVEADPEVMGEVLDDPMIGELIDALDGFWGSFEPRPNRPDLWDQQSAFVNSRDSVAFLVGGNAAGTTEAAAFKTAQFVLHQQRAPRPDTPFWIISDTQEQCCKVCWLEKLWGNGHIPEGEIDWQRVTWHDRDLQWPKSVPLKPWPDDPRTNWVLEFKSYAQDYRQFRAASIGGFWFSEEFPWLVFFETLRGCRNYLFPGGQFAEFTPTEPTFSIQLETHMEEERKGKRPGWAFYRANTELNKANLADGWFEQFVEALPEEVRASRTIGQLAAYEGLIYPSFNEAIHTFTFDDWDPYIPALQHRGGTDWGASEEHPFCHLFGAYDAMGDWWIYDEIWSIDQTATIDDHAEAVLERRKEWGWLEKSKENPKDWESAGENYGTNWADPSRPDCINSFNFAGIPTMPAYNAVNKGIDSVRKLLKPRRTKQRGEERHVPRFHVHRNCRHLIYSLRVYRWLKGKRPGAGSVLNPRAPTIQPLKRDDDPCDAARYMIYSDSAGRGATIDSARREAQGKGVQRADVASATPRRAGGITRQTFKRRR